MFHSYALVTRRINMLFETRSRRGVLDTTLHDIVC